MTLLRNFTWSQDASTELIAAIDSVETINSLFPTQQVFHGESVDLARRVQETGAKVYILGQGGAKSVEKEVSLFSRLHIPICVIDTNNPLQK